MRITFGEFKFASRNPLLRRSALQAVAPTPTPYAMANSAIRRYHREGSIAARSYLVRTLTRSPYWGSAGSVQARGWAEKVLDCFDTYVQLADGDIRPALNTSTSTDVSIGADELGVSVDVVLLDADGYVARLPLWDQIQPDRNACELFALPFALALEQEMGPERTVGVEVWHLRSATTEFVATTAALAKMPEAVTIIQRFLSR